MIVAGTIVWFVSVPFLASLVRSHSGFLPAKISVVSLYLSDIDIVAINAFTVFSYLISRMALGCQARQLAKF